MQMEDKIVLPAEWHPQSAVQLTWPHEGTDWAPILDEVLPCFASIAKEVVKWEKLLIVCPDEQEVRRQLGEVDYSRIIFREMATNDTWARDHGGITVFDQGEPVVYDFVFNGWGMKFAANLDNLITRRLSAQGTFAEGVPVINMQLFVLEGGSIESDGKGTLLTTVECLSSLNRNEYLQKEELEAYLKEVFGFERILWLENGYLAGDDTDSHIDTLARFCSEDTIAYVQRMYASELSLELLADRVHLSTAYFDRCFKKQTGYSVMQYVNKVRSMHAYQLLTVHHKGATFTATAVGFPSTQALNRGLKNNFGLTATALKNS